MICIPDAFQRLILPVAMINSGSLAEWSRIVCENGPCAFTTGAGCYLELCMHIRLCALRSAGPSPLPSRLHEAIVKHKT